MLAAIGSENGVKEEFSIWAMIIASGRATSSGAEGAAVTTSEIAVVKTSAGATFTISREEGVGMVVLGVTTGEVGLIEMTGVKGTLEVFDEMKDADEDVAKLRRCRTPLREDKPKEFVVI